MVDGRLILIARLFMLNCFYSRRITVFSCFKFVVPFVYTRIVQSCYHLDSIRFYANEFLRDNSTESNSIDKEGSRSEYYFANSEI